ncbi:MAG: PEP-CTERM sorting domain-containing protein [Colwellia sp.]|nr:PEP-CTERM sorting domain-containing protein [Colwellia sp.]
MNIKFIYAALTGLILSASCLVNVANAGVIYDFDIRVNFDGGLTSSQQDIFSEAEDFWEFFIVGYRDELVGPGLDISASGQDIDGVGGILGQAGPTWGLFLPSYVYATAGIMEFDSADLSYMETAGTLFDVIVHEMAHVIGFGTLWGETLNNLLDSSGNYVGLYGLEAYQLINPEATFIPVEQGGGPGTAGGHWDEPDGGGFSELMTGWLDPNPTISLATINSFADLGYVINPNFSVEQVPEPSTLAIFALGIMGLFSRRFKKQ